MRTCSVPPLQLHPLFHPCNKAYGPKPEEMKLMGEKVSEVGESRWKKRLEEFGASHFMSLISFSLAYGLQCLQSRDWG